VEVHRRPHKFGRRSSKSAMVPCDPQWSAPSAVVLAVAKYLCGDRGAWPGRRPGWTAVALGRKSRYLASVAYGSARRTGSMHRL